MTAPLALIDELECTIAQGSPQKRAEILLQVTDLFVASSIRFSEDEISLFDDVIVRLAAEIEISVRVMLADRLAPVEKAPIRISQLLASDDEIRVAGPILTLSERLDRATLVATAASKSQDHLLAISRRKSLCEAVTDVLLERGNREVVLSTARNFGAKFSGAGFSFLVKRSAGDDALTTCVGARPDITHELFLTLLAEASELVRTKLINEHPTFKREINEAVTTVTDDIQNKTRVDSRDYTATQTRVQLLRASGELTDLAIRAFAERGQFEEVVVAIAIICDVPIEVVERTIVQEEAETLLILAKAAQLSWGTTKLLLALRSKQQGASLNRVEQNMASFERLNASTARQIVEFYRMRRPTLPSGGRASQETRPIRRPTSAVEHSRLK